MELKTKIDADFLPYVSKPLRYTGSEYNAVLKDRQKVNLHAALCFCDIYETGIRHLSFEVAYHLLNSVASCWAERLYTPAPDAERQLSERELPLFSLESRTALHQFDLVSFFVPERLAFPNLLNMLHLGGIALRAVDRDAGAPLVIAMGPALSNPEPLAPFVDLVIIGVPHGILPELAGKVAEGRAAGLAKSELLSTLASLPGVYLPAAYAANYGSFGDFQGLERLTDSVPQRILPAAAAGDNTRYQIAPLVPVWESAWHAPWSGAHPGNPERAEKGLESRDREPHVVTADSRLYGELQRQLRRHFRGGSESLLENDGRLSAESWRYVKEKAAEEDRNLYIRIPSLEVNTGSPDTEGLAAQLKTVSGCQLYPIAGSQRLRQFLNVNLRESDLTGAARIALADGFEQLGLHFKVGLPTEKPDDIEAIVRLVRQIHAVLAVSADIQLTVYLGCFVPRPHSPLQWEKMESAATLAAKMAVVSAALEGLPIRIVRQGEGLAAVEAALCRGGRPLADVLETAWRNGMRHTHEAEDVSVAAWQAALQDAGLRAAELLSSISITVPLPWDHIDMGPNKAHLKEEKNIAYQGGIPGGERPIIPLGNGIPASRFMSLVTAAEPKTTRQQTPGSSGGAEVPEINYGRRERKRAVTAHVIRRKIRIRYAKAGASRFLSHTDVGRVFGMAAHLGKIPLVFSQGLRKYPKISYSLPLPAGISSSAEYADLEVELAREIDLQNHFNRFLPEGMRILQYRTIINKAPSLTAVINRSTYEVMLRQTTLPSNWIQTFLDQPSLPVQRISTRGETREIDIRPYLHQIECEDDRLMVSIDIAEGRSARITEVLEKFFGGLQIDYRQFPIQRTAQLIVTGDTSVQSPFDFMEG